MKTPKHLAVCIWVILAACSSADKTKIPFGKNFAVEATVPTDEGFKVQPAGTILNFLRWYRSNKNELNKIELVSHSANPDSSKYYVVNFEGTEQYLSQLQKSGFVSDKYISKWRTYFEKINEELKNTPQEKSTVKGMDFDLVMVSDEYDEDLKRIEKSTVEYQNVSNDQGTVTIGLPTVGRLKYKITKESGKWLIDDIKDMRSALDQEQND
jgi:hypothetical protein